MPSTGAPLSVTLALLRVGADEEGGRETVEGGGATTSLLKKAQMAVRSRRGTDTRVWR